MAVVVLGGAVAIAVSLTLPPPPPPPELEAVETFGDMGIRHLAPGEAAPAYNSNPPTSGPMAPAPAPCGIYRQPVSDVSQLHSMEHGAVVVQYDPNLAQDQVEALEDIGRSIRAKIIVAPRPNNPAPIALTSWTKRLLLDQVNEDVVRGFYRELGSRSPEPSAPCPFQVDEGR